MFRRNNDNHMFMNYKELSEEVVKATNRERLKMNKVLIDDMKYLEKNNVRIYIDFVEILKKNTLDNNKITEFLVSFNKTINSNKSTRIINKSNSSEKNLFLNRYVLENESEILQYLYTYLSKNFNEKQKNQIFNEFKDKIELVKKQISVFSIYDPVDTDFSDEFNPIDFIGY